MKSKTNQKLVSIIVPVYNVEKFVEQCIKSLINQTYKNIEIIMVNDGTKDRSVEIINKMMATDDRISLINQTNSGVSAARNNGLKNSKGEYIIFVDADDYLAPDFVEYMMQLVKISDSDFAYSIKNYWEDKESQSENLFQRNISSDESVGLLLSPDVTVGCWNKIYKKSFLEKNNLYFSEELYYGEGLNFIIRASLATNNISIGNKKVYYYRKNNLSSATTKYSNQKYHNGEKSLKIIYDMINYNNEYVKSMYLLHLNTFYLGAIIKLIENNKKNEYKDDYIYWNKQIRKNLFYLLKSKYVSLYRKAMLFIGAFFPKLIAFLNKQREKMIIKNSVK